MKKKLKLEGKNMLNKEQLRDIKGGYYDCGYPGMCGSGGYYTCSGGENWFNCIGGVRYSCVYEFGEGCTWHP